jgi:hypothetical protein
MRSYAFLIIVCAPLVYIGVIETKSIGIEIRDRITTERDFGAAQRQLKAAWDDSKKVANVNPALVAGTMGLGEIPDPATTGKGVESTLAEAFGPYSKSLLGTKAFTGFFQNKEAPESGLEDLANSTELLRLLKARKTRAAPLETRIRQLLAAGEGGRSEQEDSLEQKTVKYLGSGAELIDSLLVKEAFDRISGECYTEPSTRLGTVLMIVIKTRDLVDDVQTSDRIVNVFGTLMPEQKANLVCGKLMMLTASQEPNVQLCAYPNVQGVIPSGDAFRVENDEVAFRAALAAVRTVKQKRGPKPMKTVLIWRSNTAPRDVQGDGSVSASLGANDVGPVSLIWIAPHGDYRERRGIFIPWFGNDNVRVYDRLSSDFAELGNFLFPE